MCRSRQCAAVASIRSLGWVSPSAAKASGGTPAATISRRTVAMSRDASRAPRQTATVAVSNDVLRFVLELCALAALTYWGLQSGGGPGRWLLALAAPLTMGVLWGLFMSPKAAMRLRDPLRLVAEVAIFGAAVLALAAAGRPGPAMVLAAAVAVHLLLTFPLQQR